MPLTLQALAPFATLIASSSFVTAALFEPPGNQVLFGQWIDPAAGYSDTPAWLNERLGFNVPVYQLSQPIPRLPYNYVTGAGGPAAEPLVEKSGTDAAFFLTVYPTSFDAVTQSDMDTLAQQIADCTYILVTLQIFDPCLDQVLNRTVFIRYAPEMQGNWFAYGQQPTKFLESWKQLYTTLKAKTPDTIMVWAPNTGQGYPYGSSFSTITTEDQTLLDTNGDGQFTNDDDPYSPYWPGAEYVDWAGLSVYYKGTNDDTVNTVQTTGYCTAVFDGTNNVGNNSNFYQDYCVANPGIACMMSESGAAYHEADTTGATQVALQSAWIDDCITSTTFLDAHPRIKLIMNFEHEKFETANDGSNDLRDYRLTNNTDVLAHLKDSFSSIGDRFSWAGVREIPTSLSSPGAAAPATNSLGQTTSAEIPVISATTRPRDKQFPLLFGNKIDPNASDAIIYEVVQLTTMALAGIGGMAVVFRWL